MAYDEDPELGDVEIETAEQGLVYRRAYRLAEQLHTAATFSKPGGREVGRRVPIAAIEAEVLRRVTSQKVQVVRLAVRDYLGGAAPRW